ncbi:MAG: hypothetical protein WBE21_06060 [Candidatus Acidiferrales bacterium]
MRRFRPTSRIGAFVQPAAELRVPVAFPPQREKLTILGRFVCQPELANSLQKSFPITVWICEQLRNPAYGSLAFE